MFKKKEEKEKIEKSVAEPKAKLAGITEREQNINTDYCDKYYDMRGD